LKDLRQMTAPMMETGISSGPSRGKGAPGDDALLQLALVGDERAIRTLVRRYNQRLFRVARSVLRNDAEAEDVVQETYVRAFAGLSGFRGEAQLSTWLTRIALNEALGRLRRRRPTVELSDAELSERQVLMMPTMRGHADPEAEAARSHVRQVLEEAVDGLPETFRIVFILRDVEGMSIEETAGHLTIRPETVKTRLHRARKLLREAIEKRLSASFGELYPFDGARCAHMADRVIERLQTISASQ
jgi:RNA polymerase sigma-70 factor (ECF subfamily)